MSSPWSEQPSPTISPGAKTSSMVQESEEAYDRIEALVAAPLGMGIEVDKGREEI